MSVNRIARAMTSGAPGPGFKACVMASIAGRPRPDFTARVMARIEAAPPARARSRGAAFLLVPAAIVLAASAFMLRPGRVALPDVAPPRGIRAAAHVPSAFDPAVLPIGPRLALETDATERPGRRRVAASQLLADAPLSPAIYTIAALEEPSDIAMKPIDPASCTVPALTGPAPLKVTDLPSTAGGSRDREFKERP